MMKCNADYIEIILKSVRDTNTGTVTNLHSSKWGRYGIQIWIRVQIWVRIWDTDTDADTNTDADADTAY